MPTVEIWLEHASTYSYFMVARVGPLARERGVTLDWQPFFLPPVRDQQNMGFPFPEASAKTAYMWRDLARLVVRPPQQPDQQPLQRRA